MTRDLASQHRLAESLRACARGIYPDEAAIELLICHDTFLRRGDFTRHITTGDHRGNGAARAAIDWAAATTALDAGALPCSGGERRILRLAASLAAGLPADLPHIFTCLDDRNLTLAINAFIHASIQLPPIPDPCTFIV